MASGKVKWFSSQKGYGFIENQEGPDIFVHHTAILGEGYKELMAGEVVHYEVISSEKGPKAVNVQRQTPQSGS